ncbi:hypothetical protein PAPPERLAPAPP_00330 [Brevundimonas phage vB_BpoS-Papperlapapp]|uniref:Uncharacterized protein n=2 Tax=Marchewkavirus TaxID=3425052 RepID=A0A9E7MP43_9CAUD|nr:hypothetical protein KABACHOK_04530 [Brevundimonas phage vB_BpoS-Kabachok]USN14960.1 hypothetical protein DOMOVOI_05100 [Brevundimonas phage vB_BpoS-Domovoi]USN15775.1 hypothetical protein PAPPERLAPAPP_00330 [Brevundimonas phage vB_BpoS-Papperlapapp]
MPDTIYLTPFEVSPVEPRAPGELTIDREARILGVGQDSFDMSVPLLPERALGGDDVRLMTPEGVEHGPLQAGGGGRPMDRKVWVLPGCAPVAVGFLPFGGIVRTTTIALAEPARLIAMRLRSNGGTGTLTARLFDVKGLLLETHDFAINGAMTLEPGFDRWLEPGHYTIETTPTTSNLIVEHVQTMSPWSSIPQHHVVSLRFL